MAKRSLSFILVLALCFSVFAPMVMAEKTQDRGDIGYGPVTMFSDGNLICEAHTEISLTGYEEVGGEMHAIAMVAAEGSPNMVIIADLDADTVIHKYEFTGGIGGYAYKGDVHEGDGRMVMGCGNDLIMYDPNKKECKFLSTPAMNISGAYGDIRIDEKRGLIYSTEGNRGNINVTNIDTGVSTTLVNMATYWKSGSSIAMTEDYLYTSGTPLSNDLSMNLFKVHKDTGEYEIIPNRDESACYASYSYNRIIGKWLLTQVKNKTSGETENLAYNIETGEWMFLEAPIKTSMMTFIHDGKIVYLNSATNKFVSVDENLKTEYYNVSYGSHLRGTGPWIKLKDQVNYPGYSFVTAQFSGKIYAINLQSGKTKTFGAALPGPSLPHRISYLNPTNDYLYIGAFKGGFMAEVNTKTGAVRYHPASQPEGMTHDPETGFFYHGDYTHASIFEIDASKEAGRDLKNSKTRGKYATTEIGDVGDSVIGPGYQDRPFDLEVVGKELYTATLANGTRGGGLSGALSVYNLDTFEHQVWEGIVPLHGVCTITHSGKYLYGGTTINSVASYIDGDNIAKVFKFDTETKELVKTVDVVVPGLSGNNPVIRMLEISPDGKTLYVGNYGWIGKMDPDTLELTQVNIYDTVAVNFKDNAQAWHERKLHFDKATGYMFGDGGMIIDPDTLEVVAKAPGYGFFAGIDQKGYAWFVNGTAAYRAPIIRGDDKSYLMAGVSFFKTGEGTMYRNGDPLDFVTYEDNGRIMVPLRVAATSMGGIVKWDSKTNTVSLSNAEGVTLTFEAGKKVVKFDGVGKKFGINLKAENGVTYIPLQTLCDFLSVELVESNGINFIADAGSNYKPSQDLLDYIESDIY